MAYQLTISTKARPRQWGRDRGAAEAVFLRPKQANETPRQLAWGRGIKIFCLEAASKRGICLEDYITENTYISCSDHARLQRQEAPLLQRDRTTRYIKYVCAMLHKVREGFKPERFQTAKVTFKVIQGHIGNGAIRQATYDFLLVFYCNYVSILHHFRDIITCFLKVKDVMAVTWL